MVKITPTLRSAALGAMVFGFACAGFIASASAEEAGKGSGEPKAVTDVNAGAGGNTSNQRVNGVTDISGNGGNAANLRGSGGVGSGGNPTGEGALLGGSCFADMPVYNKEGKFIGRGIVNTCN